MTDADVPAGDAEISATSDPVGPSRHRRSAEPPESYRLGPFAEPASRRSVLKSAGLVALATGGMAGLAACTVPGGVGVGSSEGVGQDTPVTISKSDVPEGGGVILKDAPYVVTQPTTGDFKAFSKICTHQHCPVGEVADGQIICPCHGSHFSITDGSVVSGPAPEPLPSYTVTASGEDLTISA